MEEIRRLEFRCQRLEFRCTELVQELLQKPPGVYAGHSPRADVALRQSLSRELRKLAAVSHPDKWAHPGASAQDIATRVTQELLALRDALEVGEV